MPINCKVSFASSLIVIFAYGCGNTTSFTSANGDKNASSDDAVKQDPPVPSEQDEVPVTTSGTPEDPGSTPTDDQPKNSEKEQDPVKDEGFNFSREFKTTFEEETTIKFTPKLGILEQEFTLINAYENVDKSFTQITRPNVTKIDKQGGPGQAWTENLLQTDQGILDLLIVIDDSGSMKQEQTNLSTKIAPLLEYIKDADWRIGVVTTSPTKGCSRAVIKKGDAGIDAAFASAINAGTGGSGNEQGIRMAVEGLSCATAPFVRANSTVAVLIVSDEDNCSDGNDCSAPYNSPAYLTSYLADTMMRKLGVDARVYGLYWDPTKTCDTAANKANQYAKAVADTSGTAGSICDADYTATLQKISQNVAAILKADFTLKATPDMGSTTVKINGVSQTTGFQVLGNVLRFTEVPPKAATIEVKYVVGFVPMKDRYAMGEKPASGTVTVRLNGDVVPPTEYTIDTSTGVNDIVFKTMPPAYADIKIDFLKDIPLLKEFELGANVKAGSVTVKVNNVSTTAFTVNAAGKLTMNTAPIDAATIDASFVRLVGPVLEYQLPLVGTMLKNLTAYNKADNLPVVVSYIDGKIVVDAASHAQGKVVVLRYRNEDSGKIDVTLPYTPIMDSIDIVSGDVVCELGAGVVLEDKTLKINCDFTTADETVIMFKYKKDPLTKFAMPELLVVKDYNIVVSIDGAPITGFVVAGSFVTISDEVPYDSIVKIAISSKK